ncbi:MAG: hypothetical protein ACJAS1_006502 [Oleiphilaceae bacterium]|jgi:hypothetical protein
MAINNKDVPQHDNLGLAKNLLRFAWVVEIFAVLTGLFIAAMIGIDTLEKIVSSRPLNEQDKTLQDYINTIIAVLPFVLVAVVELAKIPVAQAAYNTIDKVWKIVFFITLTFLAIITFETTLNGFERNFSNLTFVIEKYKDKLDTTNQRIKELERQKTGSQELTPEFIETSYNTRRIELTTDRDAQVNQLTNRIAELKASVMTERTQALQQELEGLESELSQTRSEKDSEIERVVSRTDSQMDSAVTEVDSKRLTLRSSIQQIDRKILEEKSSKQAAVEKSGFFDSETRIRKEYDERIADFEKQRQDLQKSLNSVSVLGNQDSIQSNLNQKISEINERYLNLTKSLKDEISELNNEITKSISLVEADIKTSVDSLYEQQTELESKFDQQLSENNTERDRRYSLLKNNQNVVSDINARLIELNNTKVDLRNTINEEVGNNQIYRITRSWTGAESSADISRKDVARTAAFWFGSLAAIVALTGILLALASCVIKYQGARTEKDIKRPSRLINSIRRYLARRHKLLAQPKIVYVEVEKPIIQEVVKEVPVDKVVFKEVTREVVRNRVVHIPVYTNDKSLLKDSFAEDSKAE